MKVHILEEYIIDPTNIHIKTGEWLFKVEENCDDKIANWKDNFNPKWQVAKLFDVEHNIVARYVYEDFVKNTV